MKKAKVAPLDGAKVDAKVVNAVIALNLAVSNMERANKLVESIAGSYWHRLTPQMKSFISASTHSFESAQKALSLAMGVQSNEVLTESAVNTSTNKNRVPYVASEMEFDWYEVQGEIESNDERLRFSHFVKSTNLDSPNCKGCRRIKAHFVNANSKPSKAHK